ncbi:hypothetical protein MTR67_008085 [Solanum verrucosum]|uniref:Uncharacterized protein n=1 Tax=Solanum verrucosum TaxID=315347 RepID=A0AAF0Q4J2_SOLVR|nr:hypothetical protein MTR67_008085 [Solanum verrucosum]
MSILINTRCGKSFNCELLAYQCIQVYPKSSQFDPSSLLSNIVKAVLGIASRGAPLSSTPSSPENQEANPGIKVEFHTLLHYAILFLLHQPSEKKAQVHRQNLFPCLSSTDTRNDADGRHNGGNHGRGGSYRHGRDYHRKRLREDDHHRPDYPKRTYDRESRRNSDHESRPEKNPRFRESGDSDEEDDDDRKRRT